jgi:glycosyltransferase involved in cell wall biosynthesis
LVVVAVTAVAIGLFVLNATETFGNSLLEAMGSGLPCLAVSAAGVLEFARHGRNAWLVQPNSTEAIVHGLRRLLEDHALRRHLAEGGLATAKERSWDDVYDQLLQDYHQAIESLRLSQAA